jgi:hypothetical protein
VSNEEERHPHLTVVAGGNPDKARRDREREYATDALSWATRDFAANLMRILAGAGKSYELLAQVNKSVDAINAWTKLGGHAMSVNIAMEQAVREAAESPSDRIQDGMCNPAAKIRMTDEERDRFYDSGSFDIEGAKDDIVQGALRTMASRIVGQNTQERNAEHLIFEGIRRLRRGQEQSAKYYSLPTFMAQRTRERERERMEAANQQRKRIEAAKERAEQHQQVVAKKRAGRAERLERWAEPTRKIGIYDALEEQRARAAKSMKDSKAPQ